MDDVLRRSIVKAVCQVGDRFVANSDFGNAEEFFRSQFTGLDSGAGVRCSLGWILRKFAIYGSGLTADEVTAIHQMLTNEEEAAQLGQLLMLAVSAWQASDDAEAE